MSQREGTACSGAAESDMAQSMLRPARSRPTKPWAYKGRRSSVISSRYRILTRALSSPDSVRSLIPNPLLYLLLLSLPSIVTKVLGATNSASSGRRFYKHLTTACSRCGHWFWWPAGSRRQPRDPCARNCHTKHCFLSQRMFLPKAIATRTRR